MIRIAGALCLLLLAGTIWMWVRSYWWDDQFQRSVVTNLQSGGQSIRYENFIGFSTSKGKLAIEILTNRAAHAPEHLDIDVEPLVGRWQWFQYATPNLADARKGYTNWREFAGFGYGSNVVEKFPPPKVTAPVVFQTSRSILIPWRWIALLLVVGLTLWFQYERKRIRRTWRLLRGFCVDCGYDLRASRSLGCPECGRGRG